MNPSEFNLMNILILILLLWFALVPRYCVEIHYARSIKLCLDGMIYFQRLMLY